MDTIQTEQGAYLIFTRRGGFLSEDAPARFFDAAKGGADLIYADEAAINDDGTVSAVFKPDYAPDTLLSLPYIGVPFAIRRTLWEALGRPEPETEEELCCLVLRAEEKANFVDHIPSVLYTGPAQEEFDYASTVRRALKRRRIEAEAVEGAFSGSCCVRYGIPERVSAAVVVPYLGDVDAVRRTLESADARNIGLSLQYYVPFGCVPDERAKRYFEALNRQGGARVMEIKNVSKPQELKNQAAKLASEKLIVFLDAGVELLNGTALSRMAEPALRPRAGAVGGKVLSRDRTVLAAGYVLGAGLLPKTLLRGAQENSRSPLADRYLNCIQNVSAVGGGALMMDRDAFLACRGFDDTMPAYASDAEFCARAMRTGRQNLYQPYARFVREAGPAPRPTPGEKTRLRDAFFLFMEHGDPMLSRNPQLLNGRWPSA